MLLALSLSNVTGAQTSAAPIVTERDDATPSLAEILTGMETMEAEGKQLALLGADTAQVAELEAQIEEIEQTFTRTRHLESDVRNNLLDFHDLLDLGNALRSAGVRLSAVSDELASRAEALDVALDRVDESNARVTAWTKAAMKRNAPRTLQQSIDSMAPRHQALREQLLSRRDDVLNVLGRATQLHGTLVSFRDEVSGHVDQIAAMLRVERSEPIWRIEPRPGEWRRAVQVFNGISGQTLGYLRVHALFLVAIALLTLVFSYLLILATRKRVTAQAASDGYGQRVVKLFERPGVAALAAALGAVIACSRDAPSGFQHVLWSMLPLPGVLLARAVFGPSVSLSLFTLAGVVIAQELLVPIFESFPIASRVILIAQCGGLAVAFGLDLVRGGFAAAFPGLTAAYVRWVVAAIIVVLVLAVLAAIIGHIGAARVSRTLILGALNLLLVLAIAAGLLYGLFLALMHTSAGQSLRIVRKHQDTLRRTSRTALLVVMGAAWLSGVLFLLGLGDEVSSLGTSIYNAEITIGSATIRLAAFWAGLAVFLGTWLVVKVVSPMLEVEILPRFTSKQGLPFAVATVSRYLLVTAGVLLAMAAMGIDMTKMSLLAGALGVGIGFGLQAIVNNFVSGLILLMERPISVGDTIQMGTLSGVVERIGVRSSTVRTPQGAEVILPNADLISKEVTNWTLSDRKKLVEIDVGIVQWSEPGRVVSLLQAAALEVAGVMENPPPLATFSGIVANSMRFRLEAWVDDYAQGGAIESALRMAAVSKLVESHIGILTEPEPVPAVSTGPRAHIEADSDKSSSRPSR